MALSEHAARPLTGAESGNIPGTKHGDAVMIDPAEFGGMRQLLKQNTEAIGVLTEAVSELRTEFHSWRERFAFAKGLIFAVIVLAVFAGVGIKEGLTLLAKIV